MPAVSCHVTEWLLALLESRELDLDLWISRFPISAEHLQDTDQRIDWDLFAALCERLDDLFGGRAQLLDAADQVFSTRFEKIGRDCAGGVTSQRQLYWIAQRWLGPSLFPDMIGSLDELTPSTIRLRFKPPEDLRPCPVVYALLERALVAAPHFIGQPKAHVSTQSDESFATYTIALPFTEPALTQPAPDESAHHLTALTEGSDTALIETDHEGAITFVSPNAETVLGCSPTDLLGLERFEFLPRDNPVDTPEVLWDPRAPLESQRVVIQNRGRDERDRWLQATTNRYSRPDGSFRFLTVVCDITARTRAEQATRDSEALSQQFSQLAFDYSYVLRQDPDGEMCREWTRGQFKKITGYELEEAEVKNWKRIVHPEDHEAREAHFEATLEAGSAISEFRIITRSGETRWIREHVRAACEEDGTIRWFGAWLDISDQKRAELATQISNERYRVIAESSQDVIAEFDATGILVYVSPNIQDVLGYNSEALLRSDCRELIHPDDRTLVMEQLGKMLQTGDSVPLLFRVRRNDGAWRWIDSSASAFQAGEGNAHGILIARDITSRLKSDRERRRMASVVQNSSELVTLFALDGRILFMNDAGRGLLGIESEAEARTRSIFDCLVEEDARNTRFSVIPDVLHHGQWEGECRFQHATKDESIPTLASAFIVSEEEPDSVRCVAIVARDITERKLAESALKESEQRFRTLIENAYDLVAEINDQRRFVYVSHNYRDLLGYAPEDLLGRSIDDLLHSDDRVLATTGSDSLPHQPGKSRSHRFSHRDGSWRWLESHSSSIQSRTGETLTVLTSRDITARKRAEDELRESREQFLQSQKMEAIGRLAGGVAHDFNNLLTAITGNCDLLLDEIHADHPARADASEILHAAERAGDLTRQLLAFSRRQALQPKVLDLNAAVSNVDRLLRRLIGEDIELLTLLTAEAPRVRVDPGQLEQIIMNLAVNGRDAMPRGGELAIETATIEIGAEGHPDHRGIPPGEFITLAVRDSGVGMDEETASRVFEPFFTTKERGKGTGLGLSTVYGIVQQSGGYIRVESRPGDGSTFTIYLSRVHEAPQGSDSMNIHSELRGTETILLVEDSESVRKLVRRFLEKHGYIVLDASSGIEALRLSRHHKETIDLLITDVVLPKLDGPEIAIRLKRQRPEIQVIFMSGFSDDALSDHGVLDTVTALVQKPFAPSALLKKIRETLDAPTTVDSAEEMTLDALPRNDAGKP